VEQLCGSGEPESAGRLGMLCVVSQYVPPSPPVHRVSPSPYPVPLSPPVGLPPLEDILILGPPRRIYVFDLMR